MLAIKRLPPKEAYDRVFRMRRAFQVRQFLSIIELPCTDTSQMSLSHQLLPKEEWTKPEEVRQTVLLYKCLLTTCRTSHTSQRLSKKFKWSSRRGRIWIH